MFFESLWSFIWTFFVIFAIVAYIFALFYIITDLFRDHKLSGWWKAVWILFLIIFPILTALAYLIFRGDGMTERAVQSARQQKAAADEYIRDTAQTASPAAQIKEAKSLLDDGTITDAEYKKLKAKALG